MSIKKHIKKIKQKAKSALLAASLLTLTTGASNAQEKQSKDDKVKGYIEFIAQSDPNANFIKLAKDDPLAFLFGLELFYHKEDANIENVNMYMDYLERLKKESLSLYEKLTKDDVHLAFYFLLYKENVIEKALERSKQSKKPEKQQTSKNESYRKINTKGVNIEYKFDDKEGLLAKGSVSSIAYDNKQLFSQIVSYGWQKQNGLFLYGGNTPETAIASDFNKDTALKLVELKLQNIIMNHEIAKDLKAIQNEGQIITEPQQRFLEKHEKFLKQKGLKQDKNGKLTHIKGLEQKLLNQKAKQNLNQK